MRKPIRITENVQLYPITVQPGELVQDLELEVSDLLKTGETVSSVQADTVATIPAATGSGRSALIDINGPANGVQVPVRLTVNGSMLSVRHIAILVIGRDPFAALATVTPNIYLRWRGSYQPAATYLPYDLVLYGGIIYLALVGSTGAAPDISVTQWMAWAGTGEGGGGSSLIPDAGGSGRYAAFRMTWAGPGDDDWTVEVVGVQQ